MRPLIQEIVTAHTPESLVDQLGAGPGVVLLRTAAFDSPSARYSFVAARPFLTFRSLGSRCEVFAGAPGLPSFYNLNVGRQGGTPGSPHPGTLPQERENCRRSNREAEAEFESPPQVQFGNPWEILDGLMARCEVLDEIDRPFPLGGCFGYWGYDLKQFTEPKLPHRTVNDLEVPDCQVGFYDSLVVFDHELGQVVVVSTGVCADGSRSEQRAREQLRWWQEALQTPPAENPFAPHSDGEALRLTEPCSANMVVSNLSREEFIAAVERARRYIRSGDIYQVNLSQRLAAPCPFSGWELFRRLTAVSPSPFAAFLNGGDFQIASSSPELFLRLSGAHILTRPIKGTRPRGADPTQDARHACELQTSPKELAELVMITDLLRNDLGRVCAFGSVQAPELARLERFAQVQHLVSTVEGRLRPEVTHFAALAACFPGGSITGAPKFRAMEIIDELEPVARGPYTGCHGYLGFNRESQLSISIRTAVCLDGQAYFHAGAGIVADSVPAAEYEETLAKAAGFLAALRRDAAG
jgi:para-aminobenzoate synthetase component 1